MSAEMPEAENKDLVARFFEHFSTGDIGGSFARFMADDATWQITGNTKGISGTLDLPALLERVLAGMVGGALPIIPTAMIAEGDRVAGRWASSASASQATRFSRARDSRERTVPTGTSQGPELTPPESDIQISESVYFGSIAPL